MVTEYILILYKEVKMTKKDKVWKVLIDNPLMPNRAVADMVGCSINYVSIVRKKVGTPKEVFVK